MSQRLPEGIHSDASLAYPSYRTTALPDKLHGIMRDVCAWTQQKDAESSGGDIDYSLVIAYRNGIVSSVDFAVLEIEE